ncbi:DUF4168 domain-containing protein [Salinisphaera sp. SPP-AMP-43]|uniref:DUF4168 domain-containing protein n=1 Tax=Salinisphaera sp. SPP-AMP-43 TaxID=3121288 RepID=UPI003C6E1CE8
MRTFLGISAGALIAVSLAGPAFAQGNSGQQQGFSSQNSGQHADFSKSQIQSFAEAQQDLQSVVSDWQSKINNADSKKQARQYHKQMNSKIISTIKNDGLSVQQYNQIAQASSNDPKLAQRIQQAGS